MLSDIPFDFKRFKIKSTTLKKKKLKKKEIITFELSEHTYKNWSETDDLHVLHVDIVSSSCYKTVVYLWPFNNVYIFVFAHNMIKNSFSLIRLLLLHSFFFSWLIPRKFGLQNRILSMPKECCSKSSRVILV